MRKQRQMQLPSHTGTDEQSREAGTRRRVTEIGRERETGGVT